MHVNDAVPSQAKHDLPNLDMEEEPRPATLTSIVPGGRRMDAPQPFAPSSLCGENSAPETMCAHFQMEALTL